MTIRFTCGECASILKIKDELSGTPARCPKCKTKFIVPAAQLETQASGDSVEVPETLERPKSDDHGLVSDHAEMHRSIPTETPAAPPESTLAEDRGLVPSGFDPAKTLRLDDSDADLDAVDEPAVSHQMPQADSAEVTVISATAALANPDDFDDLDSPPMMVAHPMLATRSISTTAADQKSELPSYSFDRPTKTSKSSHEIPTVAAFDPLKFMTSDPPTDPANNHDSLPANAGRQNTNGREKGSDYSLPVDSATDPLDRTTARTFNRPTPAVKSSSRPQTEKVDLATAAKMMKKAIKDSQAEEAHQREIDAKAGFDYGAIFREFGLKGLGILVGSALVCMGLYFAADRMFSNRLKLPKLGYVQGTVKLDGKPLAGAMVNFAPEDPKLDGAKNERIRNSIGVADENGQFRMMYIPADRVEGVAAGRCRVWVSHIGPKGRSDVPADWSEGATVYREITPGNQKAPFDIDMQTKKR